MTDESPELQSIGRNFCLVAPIFQHGIQRLEAGKNYIVGRDHAADVILPGRTISRRHASISWVGIGDGGFLIEDLKSSNGIRVGAEKIQQHFLQDGDVISIGTFRLRYRQLEGDWSTLLQEADFDQTDTKRISVDDIAPDAQLSGSFDGTELLEICQLIEANQKSGHIEVRGDAHTGSLAFRHGKLVAAVAGRLKGLEAAQAMLSLEEGTFDYRKTPLRVLIKERDAVPQTPIPVSGLLLELLRQRDESHQGTVRGDIRNALTDPPPFDPTGDTAHD